MISSISSFKVINAFVPYLKPLFGIAASVADAADVNSNGTKTLLANCVRIFFIIVKVVVINGLRKFRNPIS